jgi:hypothetical protein
MEADTLLRNPDWIAKSPGASEESERPILAMTPGENWGE